MISWLIKTTFLLFSRSLNFPQNEFKQSSAVAFLMLMLRDADLCRDMWLDTICSMNLDVRDVKRHGLYFLGLALEPYYRECYIRHTFIRQGGTSVVNCQGLLPWTHCHIACASPQLSSCPKSIGSCSILKMRFLAIQFKAALVWPGTFDCSKASIHGPSLQRLWS